jgi:hypothetical protein
MGQIINLLCWKTPKSAATTLLLLGIVEHATRHAFGCEAFLGWWPRTDLNSIPGGSSDGYCSLLKLLLEKERHDIASLATYVLQRLRFYEILSKYEVRRIPMPESPIQLTFTFNLSVLYVDDKKLLVVWQSAVVKVISDLPADKLSTDGVPFLISASVELAEMSVRLSLSFYRQILIAVVYTLSFSFKVMWVSHDFMLTNADAEIDNFLWPYRRSLTSGFC